MKKILAVLLSTSIMFGAASPAMARDHDRNGRDWGRNNDWSRNYDRHDNHVERSHHKDKHHTDGWGIALGVLAGAAAVAIATDSHSYYEPAPVVYAPPAPVYTQPVYVPQTYVERTYRPVTVQRTVYEPRTFYSTEYQPEYRQVTRYAEVY